MPSPTRSCKADQVDLTSVVAKSVARIQPAAARRGIELTTDPQPTQPTRLNADPDLLERLVDNLVDNALRHNVDGGMVRIALRAVARGTELVVVNTGPIVSPAEVDGLFEPFHRASRGAGDDRGFGLGLAMVRSVATTHHGEIDAAANPDGGLTVRVTLPAHEPPAE